MSKSNDRLDMLKIISLFEKYDDMSIFESYIPHHYDELYSIYTLFKKSGIDYNSIDFNEPSENNDGSFNINFNCTVNIFKKLEKFISNNKSIKYLRNHSYSINLLSYNIDDDTNNVIISFNKEIKEG